MLAAMLRQQGTLLQGFHPCADDRHLMAGGQRDGRLHGGLGGIVGAQALHQGMRELELVQGSCCSASCILELPPKSSSDSRTPWCEAGEAARDIRIQRTQGLGGKLQQQQGRVGPCLADDALHLLGQVGLPELPGADVDADGQPAQLQLGFPSGQLLAGGLNAPAAQRNDDVGLLCHRQEDARWYQSSPGMAPAQQGFQPLTSPLAEYCAW
jgi:hypothetical protein